MLKHRKTEQNKPRDGRLKKKSEMKNKTFAINVSPSELWIRSKQYTDNCLISQTRTHPLTMVPLCTVGHNFCCLYEDDFPSRRRMLDHEINVEGKLHSTTANNNNSRSSKRARKKNAMDLISPFLRLFLYSQLA